MIVGILGGIGAGKTTVTRMFAELGAEVVDADALAHEALETPESRRALVAWLGAGALRSDGTVDRALVARNVFQDRTALQRLEELVHPEVLRAIRDRVAAHDRRTPPGAARSTDRGATRPEASEAGAEGLLVLDVPLLLDTPVADSCDALVFVDAPAPLRAQRVALRGWTPQDLEDRERFQRSVEDKRRAADWIIVNDGDLDGLRRRVRECRDGLLAAGPRRSGRARGAGDGNVTRAPDPRGGRAARPGRRSRDSRGTRPTT